MAYTDLPPLARIAKEAGKKIRAMRPAIQAEYAAHPKGAPGGDISLLEWKPDGSPVTAADKAAHEYICDEIKKEPTLKDVALTSYLPVLSEEGSETEMKEAMKKYDRIETDPLDGTATYISSDPRCTGYSVNIGRIIGGEAREGAVYFPEMGDGKGELYFTRDGKAYKQTGDEPPREIRVAKRPPGTMINVAVGFNEQNTGYLGHDYIQAEKAPGQYRTCLVAEGKADLTGLNVGQGGSFHTYDIAGPHAVLRAAGGEIITYDPATPGENKPFLYTSETTTDVPAHIAGSLNELVMSKLANRKSLGIDRGYV